MRITALDVGASGVKLARFVHDGSDGDRLRMDASMSSHDSSRWAKEMSGLVTSTFAVKQTVRKSHESR